MKSIKLFLLSILILFSSQVFCEKESQKDLDQQLISATKNGNLEQIKSLIQAGTDVNAKDNNGWIALMDAACLQPEVVKHLIEAGADVNAKDNNGWTALMKAAKSKKSEAIEHLVLAGEDLNQIKNSYPIEYKKALEYIKKKRSEVALNNKNQVKKI